MLIGTLTGLSLSSAAFQGSIPETTPTTTRSVAAEQADSLFWKVFNGGEYDNIPVALNALTAAYLADPNDPTTARHIGDGLHLWRLSEQARLDQIPATITDHAVLARKYLQDSVRLKPDARYLGQGEDEAIVGIFNRGAFYARKDAQWVKVGQLQPRRYQTRDGQSAALIE